jgi:hypothetical protein
MHGWYEYLSKVAIMLAVIGLLATFAISYQSAGLAEGLSVGEMELDEFKASIGDTSKIHFAADGAGTYARLARDYGLMACLFGIATLSMLVGRFQKHGQITMSGSVAVLVSCLLILYKLRLLIRDKAIMEPHFWEAPRNAFAHSTIAYDWIIVGISLSMMVCLATVFILRRPAARATY